MPHLNEQEQYGGHYQTQNQFILIKMSISHIPPTPQVTNPASRPKKSPPLSSFDIINKIPHLAKHMYNSFLMGTTQNPIYLCAYFPITNYINPFSCIQYATTSPQFENPGNTQKILENAGVSTQQTQQKQEPKASNHTLPQPNPTVSKRRNYRTKSKLIQSAKKNGQSNIINHILSFLTKHRQSETILQKAINKLQKPQNSTEPIKQLFYNLLNLINLKRERKYINRRTILSLFRPEDLRKQLPFIDSRLEQLHLIEIDELCYLYRVCIFYYIRNQSHTAILTSKRIENVAKKIHLKRRSFILQEITAE